MEGLTNQERRDLILSVGTHRRERRLSPIEVARLLQVAIGSGATKKDCSETLQIGVTQISTFLKLLQLAPEVQDLAGWGAARQASIPFSSMAALARLDATDHLFAANAILSERLTWKEVIELTQIAKRSGKGVDECLAAVLRRRPEIERRHVFIGKVDPRTETDLAALSQRARDALLWGAFAAIMGSEYQFEARLGITHFTILTSDDILQPLGMTPDDLEQDVNARMRKTRLSSELSD